MTPEGWLRLKKMYNALLHWLSCDLHVLTRHHTHMNVWGRWNSSSTARTMASEDMWQLHIGCEHKWSPRQIGKLLCALEVHTGKPDGREVNGKSGQFTVCTIQISLLLPWLVAGGDSCEMRRVDVAFLSILLQNINRLYVHTTKYEVRSSSKVS